MKIKYGKIGEEETMQIKLREDLLDRVGVKLLQKCGVERRNWQKFEVIELIGLDVKILKELEEVIAPHAPKGPQRLKGALKCLKAIRLLLQAFDAGNDKEVKIKNVSHFETLLIAYMAKVSGHRIFQQDEDRGFNTCYYTESIKYHPPVKHRNYITPAYVTMELTWLEFGGRDTKRISFVGQEIRGLTVREVLIKKDLFPETIELRKEYLEERDRFNKESKLIGKQFLATGYATDDVDGNDEVKTGWWRSTSSINLEKDDIKSNVVIDVFRESEKDDRDRDNSLETDFWKGIEPKDDIQEIKDPHEDRAISEDEAEEDDDDGEDAEMPETTFVEIPVYPLLVVFDLKKHRRLKVHIGQLEEYKYDKTLGDKLILPKENHDLVETLLAHNKTYKDVVKGKGQGAIILCVGPAGTGKTLTSEVFAEVSSKPLYTVQCSQLGTSADDLEESLLKIFARAQRWKAILLLDEADVYIRARGEDLGQNAIVGVFLRTLEYYAGIMFMTTNRPDIVDDAIASRCIARVQYEIPSPEDQKKIWGVLADSAKVKIEQKELDKILEKHMELSGRDIKNLLKLAIMVSLNKKVPITAELIGRVKRFKPTTSDSK